MGELSFGLASRIGIFGLLLEADFNKLADKIFRFKVLLTCRVDTEFGSYDSKQDPFHFAQPLAYLAFVI